MQQVWKIISLSEYCSSPVSTHILNCETAVLSLFHTSTSLLCGGEVIQPSGLLVFLFGTHQHCAIVLNFRDFSYLDVIWLFSNACHHF